MNYRIVATLGPATDGETIWRSLLEAGATAFRLNTTHFQLEMLQTWLERIARYLADERDGSSPEDPFPVILDLQASKWRIGSVEPAVLATGAAVELVLGTAEGAEPDRTDAGPRILPVGELGKRSGLRDVAGPKPCRLGGDLEVPCPRAR